MAKASGKGKRVGQCGQATHDEVLLGMHFFEGGADSVAQEIIAKKLPPKQIAYAADMNKFEDFLKYMPDDLKHMSYADFWKWWFQFERYKGDEAGLAAFDRVIDECLARGIKVKVDLAYSTWWAMDNDWTTQTNRIIGPRDVDEWIHLCQLLGRRYRGKVVLYLLQGESNNLKDYWEGAPVEHASDVFIKGYKAFKKEDPNLLIGIAGAAQCCQAEVDDPNAPADASLNNWVRAHVKACKPYFDDVPMNFFADIPGGDLHDGFANYYKSTKKIYEDNGVRDAEIGSGESCIQWALGSDNLTVPPPTSSVNYDFQNAPFSEMKQAWRMNNSMGDFYKLGGTKYMWWGTEFSPGVGWPWRWGFRKYEDHWGVWPADYKVEGTKIVYKHEGDDEANPPIKPCDFRPAWVRPEDPYHPMWETYKFWVQASPPASEAIRLPMTLSVADEGLYSVATFLMANNLCVALIQTDKKTAGPISAVIDLSKSNWPKGMKLKAEVLNEDIDYATGIHTTNWQKTIDLKAAGKVLTLDLPALKGWTTIRIRPASNVMAAEYVEQILPDVLAVGHEASGYLVVRNSGTAKWKTDDVTLAMYAKPGDKREISRKKWKLASNIGSGDLATFRIEIPVQDTPGYCTWFYRLKDKEGNWFGPVMSVSADFSDQEAPRKLVAHRELGHVRLQWFMPLSGIAPENGEGVKEYRVFRSAGFEKPFKKLATVKGTDYVDADLDLDAAYYYNVKAVYRDGRVSNSSNDDNARALSKSRIWDAEIVAHTIPGRVRLGDHHNAAITIKNTGQRAWDMSEKKQLSFGLMNTQGWGVVDLAKLPEHSVGDKTIKPGQTVTVPVPYAGPCRGLFENQWIMVMRVASNEPVMFGSPVLVETVVE